MSTDTSKMKAEDISISLENILPSLAKNLYGDDWRISIRELLQNAHDALAERPNWNPREVPQIDIIPDPDAGTLTFKDNGIGMTLDEVRNYLATVGSGRKREQIERLKGENKSRDALKNIIGQYGIGFLSSFIIAQRVEVLTRSATNTTAPGTRAVFTGETKWYHEETKIEEYGTRVVVYLKREPVVDPITGRPTSLTELLSFQRLQEEVHRFGDLLPYPIYVYRGPKDRSPVLGNTTAGPWEKPNCQRHLLIEFLKTRHPNENEPLWAEPFQFQRAANGVEAHGILYFPNPARELRASFESVARVDLFSRRMFITDDITPLLPEWAKFVGIVAECPDLTPTLNRNDVVRHDPAFVALKQALSKLVTDSLIFIAEKQPRDFVEFLGAHTERLYTGMLENWRNTPDGQERATFFGAFINHIPFNVVARARPDGQFMTLPQYLKEHESVLRVEAGQSISKRRVYYLGDPLAYTQYRAMIVQKDFPVIIPHGMAEPVLLKAYGGAFKEEVELIDVRAMLDLYLDKVDEAPYEQLVQFLEALDGGAVDEVKISRFSPNYVPAFVTMSLADTSQQAKAIEAFLEAGGSILDPKLRQTLEEAMVTSRMGRAHVTLTLNANNVVVQKLRDHCGRGNKLAGASADVLHEIYHIARAMADATTAVSDHYFEHRNNLLSNLVDLELDHADLQKRHDQQKLQLKAFEEEQSTRNQPLEARDCAMLLTDLRGSTRMVGFLDSDKAAEILRGYADKVRAIVEAKGGKVEKFTGDGLFAYFWAPRVAEQSMVQKATAAAFEILGATASYFNEDPVKKTLAGAGGIRVSGCRTVLHWGEVRVGGIAGTSALVGKNVVLLFRALEKASLFEKSSIILTEPLLDLLAPAPRPDALQTDVSLDPALPTQTFYPHPSLAAHPNGRR